MKLMLLGVMNVVGLVSCGFPRPSDIVGPDAGGVGGDGGTVDTPQSTTPSCVTLPRNCGINGNDNCCASPIVPGDRYFRGYDLAGDSRSGTLDYPATVSDFRLDKYEVTVGRFRAFVNAGMGTQLNPPSAGAGAHAYITGSGWDATWNAKLAATTEALVARVKCDAAFQTWTDGLGSNENRPANCILWYEAMAFCIWDGGYLPTEAESNYAAVGGNLQRAYPWSNPPGSLFIDGAHASYEVGTDCIGDEMPGCNIMDLVEVGTKPAGDGRWGQADLAGNVFEWNLDWLGAYPNPCTDCANLTMTDDIRIVRGGDFHNPDFMARPAFRSVIDLTSTTRISSVGVRCARPL
jgi:formylglycine-generating enzyme required for sulfatase activity